MAHFEPLALLVLLANILTIALAVGFPTAGYVRATKTLFFIVAVIVVMCFMGLLGGIAGGAIHLLLVVAVALCLLQLVRGRRTV